MKFNIEVEISDMYEDGSLDEVFMDALKQELSYKVADILAKDAFQNLIRNPDIEAVKEAYTKALRNLERGMKRIRSIKFIRRLRMSSRNS